MLAEKGGMREQAAAGVQWYFEFRCCRTQAITWNTLSVGVVQSVL